MTAFADVHNLTIPECFVEDGGNYMVKATNKAGEAKCYAKLTIRPPPQVGHSRVIQQPPQGFVLMYPGSVT